MPPRKRARISRAQSTDLVSQPKSPSGSADAASPSKEEQLLHDPWTDEEEVGLFKGLMRWKPTGLHKHFHMLALREWLLEQGFISQRNAHTRPAGIWTKLGAMYDLGALDRRENARQLPRVENPLLVRVRHEDGGGGGDGGGAGGGRAVIKDEASEGGSAADSDGDAGSSSSGGDDDDDDDDDDAYSQATNRIATGDFALPQGEGFEEMMWRQRFRGQAKRPLDEDENKASDVEDDDDDEEEDEDDEDDDTATAQPKTRDERESSPPVLPELNMAEEPPVGFTPSFSIGPDEATKAKPGRGRGRGAGAAAAAAAAGASNAATPAKGRAAKGAPSRRSARQAEHTAEGGEEAKRDKRDESKDADDADEDGDDDGDDDGADAHEDESQAGTPAPRATRSAAESRRRSLAPSRSTRRTRK